MILWSCVGFLTRTSGVHRISWLKQPLPASETSGRRARHGSQDFEGLPHRGAVREATLEAYRDVGW